MFENWKIAWRYFKESWGYVKANPKLFKIPLAAIGLWFVFTLPIFVITGYEIFFFIVFNQIDYRIIMATLIIDSILLWFLTYLVMYVYAGMIVAAVYANEIGRKEGLLDNLKGNWGALAKFALLTTLFSIGLYVMKSVLGRASPLFSLLGKFAAVLIAQIYQLLTAFTVCAIVIEELNMTQALKRSVELVRKNLVAVVFGLLISDVMGAIAIFLIFGSLFAFLGIGAALSQVFGSEVIIYCLVIWFIFFITAAFGTALIASLVINVYYSKLYLDNLKREGSPLYRFSYAQSLSFSYDEKTMEYALRGYKNIDALKPGMEQALDWWESKLGRWVNRGM
ncbi:MAG: hypothetical protein ACPL1Y_03325 [Thermoplasmata archaeon]